MSKVSQHISNKLEDKIETLVSEMPVTNFDQLSVQIASPKVTNLRTKLILSKPEGSYMWPYQIY